MTIFSIFLHNKKDSSCHSSCPTVCGGKLYTGTMDLVFLPFETKKGDKSSTKVSNFLVLSLPFLSIFDPVLQLLYRHLGKKDTEFINFLYFSVP